MSDRELGIAIEIFVAVIFVSIIAWVLYASWRDGNPGGGGD